MPSSLPDLTPAEAAEVALAWELRWLDLSTEWDEVRVAPVPDHWDAGMDSAMADHAALVAERRWVHGPWSIMEALGRHHRETDHSRVLAWLLDPGGGHGLGDSVLCAVLDRLEIAYARRNIASALVRREVAVATNFGAGSIDVLVEWSGGTVVIENKVRATVHGEQLQKYAEAYPRATLVFLTPHGRPPTERESGGSRWHPVSWRSAVLPDLERVAGEARALGRPCPALEDYAMTLRKEMT